MMPIPFPSMHRSPMVITGSPVSPACEGIPALMLAKRPDRRARRDRDATFAVDHRRRERDETALTERVERRGDGVVDPSRRSARRVPTSLARPHPRGVELVPQHASRLSVGRFDYASVRSSAARLRSVTVPGSASSTTSRRVTERSRTRCGSDSPKSPRRVASIASSSSSPQAARGLPAGSEREWSKASKRCSTKAPPSSSARDLRQRLDRRAALRRGRDPGHQLHRRRAHALAVDVPLPSRLARGGTARARARLVERGLRSAACCSISRPVGRRYFEAFEGTRSPRHRGHRFREHRAAVGERRRPPRAPAAGNPDALVYFGLGVSSRAVSLARSRSAGTCRCSRTRR